MQLVSVELLANGTSLATVLISAFIISSRHFLYGLSLREKLVHSHLDGASAWDSCLPMSYLRYRDIPRSYKNQLRLWYALGVWWKFLYRLESMDFNWHYC